MWSAPRLHRAHVAPHLKAVECDDAGLGRAVDGDEICRNGASGAVIRFATRRQPCVKVRYAGDEACYARLEEARIRCEGICQNLEDPRQGEWLRMIHRELGFAGYAASEHIPAFRRGRILTVSRSRATTRPARPLSALEAAVERARTVVEATLESGGSGDHLHLAHVHVAAALDLLCWPPPFPNDVGPIRRRVM